MKQLKKWDAHKKAFFIICASAVIASSLMLGGCSAKKVKTVTIWTNSQEFAPYAELFNSTHDSVKALLVYKENPAKSLADRKGEPVPDIVVGPWLRTSKTARYFRSIDTVFDRNNMSQSSFYAPLLAAGRVHHTQYLLPVSYNLPAVVFSTENSGLISDSYVLSLDDIRRIGASYNKRNDNGLYSRIGFAPQSNTEFLYLAAKLKGAKFRESRSQFTWSEDGLKTAVDYLHSWTSEANTSSKAEKDFSFKYLYMPGYKQVTSGRTLFAYATSDQLFRLSAEQTTHIDYRWIEEDGKMPVADSIVMLGVPKHSWHLNEAYDFISWLLTADTQHKILEFKAKTNLDTNQFGIAGGFSSIKEVNEHILPLYYTMLLSNTPSGDMLSVPEKLPANWNEMKEQIVIPYLAGAVSGTVKPTETLEARIAEWHKQNYN